MVLVTGGTGFIGAYIIRELVHRGHRVRALRRNAHLPFFIEPVIFNKVEWMNCDILDPVGLDDAMKGVEAVIHAAAIVSFREEDRRKLYKTNIEGTANVVNAAIENYVSRMIYISSVAALGRTGNGSTVDEEKKWSDTKVNTDYGISKYHAELQVWRGFAEGLNGVIMNPSTVLGYGDWNSSSCSIFKTAYREFPWYTNGINGFVDVEDVAKAAVLLLESPITNQRFIVNSDNWSFQQLLSEMAIAFGKKPPTRIATPILGNVAWRWEKIKSFLTGNKPIVTRQSARVAQSKTYFDNRKILQALPGFSFTPLQQTIRNACSRYLAKLDQR